MEVEIKVPMMGESVSEAIISSFLVAPGSYVSSGAEILELETDKVNQVLYAADSGVVVFLVSIGDTVKVGQKIGIIETSAQKPLQETTVSQEVKPKEAEIVTPASIEGIRKTEADFVAFLQKEESISEPQVAFLRQEEAKPTRKKMTTLRKTIATKLVEVKNKTAMLTTFNEIDMSAVMTIRAKEKESFEKEYGVKLGFMSFFVKATVQALKDYPLLNSYIEGDEIVTLPKYDIGVAVSTDKGLLVPVLRDASSKSFGDIEKEIAGRAKKAREGSIAIDDLKGGSFTITNGGVFGSLLSTPILNPPQSGILGMHAIVKRPIAVGEEVVIRPMMYVALSYDHRIIDGKEAVLFLVHIKESLENPARLLLDL